MPPPEGLYVTQGFREYLTQWYPEAFEQESYTRLLQELLFPNWRDRRSGKVVLSRASLASIEGREDLLRRHRYVGEDFLTRFQEDTGLALTVTHADWWAGQARTVEATWRDGLEKLLSIELHFQPEERVLVDFYTGKPMAPTALARQRRDARHRRKALCDTPEIRLLNHVAPQAYAQFESQIGEAQDIAASYEASPRRYSNLRTLFALSQRGLAPTYRAAQNTPRIYTQGISMAQLSSNVRSILLSGAWSLDLTAAQLAIIAKLWKLPRWQELLAASVAPSTRDIWEAPSRDVWPLLLQAVGLDVATNKRAFKTLVYATAYGMSLRNLQARAIEMFGNEAGGALMATKLMRDLLDGRRERQERVKETGSITDAFGKTVTLAERRQNMRAGSAVSSLLAHEAQAMELYLMQPVFDKFRRDDRFRVVLWLHDGCYVTTGRRPEEKQIGGVARAVDERAEREGIATRLAHKLL